MQYEAVIGLEIHVQVKTRTKMFTAAPYNYGAAPNTLTDAVVLGLPGTLPVLNHTAIEKCAKLGLMLGCEIAEVCKWDRKNYFYPDSPKNYQLTQNEEPLCIGGKVEIELPGPSRNVEGEHRWVTLNRIHLEEDPGKLTHEAFDTVIDFNRAGVPLAEIVTEPDMSSSVEAVAFLNCLRNMITYADISDCDMEKGQMRCDANVSIRPVGSDKLGTRTEMKNLNSISNVKASIEYEIERQTEILEEGGAI
ncbi:Asp-tRNA(Asn)/Glu-tRNA(Gln) amidotransferase subunit GatB, partial [Opitutales bacterium]|nr:Asp-tRNA(Asn)/Glu-tRNA(Gln) amidotransferase subunit GatB [Opitutales bacterium]